MPIILTASLIPAINAIAPPLKAGIVTKSTVFARGDYLLKNASENSQGAAIVVRGDNLTIDFGGATLRGTAATVAPDKRQGTGILVRGKNIVIKNVHVRGYKIGLLAMDAPGLKVVDSDFSYNWKQHLSSTIDREDLSDWMSYHHNEKDEWLGYGAGIYLRRCNHFEVRNCYITGGQCGLMLTESNQGLVWNNDFSFLSGIGIGLYRSSGNRVMHNRVDWCVRGYSHGVYNRGQDSAGILIYEQSDKNIFAYNSVTHGGDGFFLWAGQTTMDTGKGGCNDNLVFGNDFSHAPTNGIESTFSRNTFANNKVWECWHGVWGGYSFNTLIRGNIFGLNAEAIAIEHGQNNTIFGNAFYRNNRAIHLWANDTQDPNWGYPKNHDTESHDYNITENFFVDTLDPAVLVRKSKDIRINANLFVNSRVIEEQKETVGVFMAYNREEKAQNQQPVIRTIADSGNPVVATEQDPSTYIARFAVPWNAYQSSDRAIEALAPTPLKGAKDPFLKGGMLRGRRYILVDEWGPYDFRRPLLWPRQKEPGKISFEVLGPKGKWRVKDLSPGVQLLDPDTGKPATSGTVPGRLVATVPNDRNKALYIKVRLAYMGAKTTDFRGITTPAGKPVPFGYSEFFAPIDWKVRFYTWEKDKSDPRTQPEAFAERLKEEPVKSLSTDHLDFAGRFADGVPGDYFATVAEGTVTLEPGNYILEVTTDDGCRVFLDDKPIITDAWKYQGPTLYTAALKLAGTHTIRVEHFQIDGYATLKVNLRLQAK